MIRIALILKLSLFLFFLSLKAYSFSSSSYLIAQSAVALYDYETASKHYEQEDLCKRIRQIDQKIYVCQKIKFDHAGSKSSHPKFQHQVKIMRNWHYCWGKFNFYKKHFGYLKGLEKTLPNFFRSIKNIIISIITNNYKKVELHKAEFRGLLNAYLLQKSSFRILE